MAGHAHDVVYLKPEVDARLLGQKRHLASDGLAREVAQRLSIEPHLSLANRQQASHDM
jgi:hypothetical protein